MGKTTLIYGALAGIITTGLMYALSWTGDMDFGEGEVFGYASMVIGMAMIFFGIKHYRDKQLDGRISFGKAFLQGLYMTFIAGVIYVLGWEYYYNTSASDFMVQYSEYIIEQAQQDGASAGEIAAKKEEMAAMQEWYAIWYFRCAMTLAEILPVGLIFSLGSALVLKRK